VRHGLNVMAISRMRLFNIFFGKLPDLISDVKGAILGHSISKQGDRYLRSLCSNRAPRMNCGSSSGAKTRSSDLIRTKRRKLLNS
jgi:hypothetical protein